MKTSTITLYRNTPFTDFVNTIDFGSNERRESHFQRHYEQYTYSQPYNWVSSRLQLDVTMDAAHDFKFMSGVNYARIDSGLDDNVYYLLVVNTEYRNDKVARLTLVIDGYMTFGQGGISKYAKNVQIERQHLTDATKTANLKTLRTNSDILQFDTLEYVDHVLYQFTDLGVVFLSAADLSSDFGTVDDPKVKTSHGQNHDGITAPQNIYVIREYDLFNQYMKLLQDYPWITQNISEVHMVPADMIDLDDLIPVKGDTVNFPGLTTFKAGTKSAFNERMATLDRSWDDIIATFQTNDPAVLRQPYTNIELTDWRGQNIEIDPAFLPEDGLQVAGEVTTGYHNEAIIFPKNYKSDGEPDVEHLYKGTYWHNGISFTNFDDVPVLTNEYKMTMAQNANQRQLAEDRLVSNRVNNIASGTDNTTRFMDAVNVLSNVSPAAIGGKLTDEYEFYRDQKAQFADAKIKKPSISSMGSANSFVIGRNIYGVTAQYSSIGVNQIRQVEKYHKHFGYQWQSVSDLEDTNSQHYLNYVKFKGNWIINDRNVPQSVMEQMRIIAETGLKIWHNPDDLDNPFTQEI